MESRCNYEKDDARNRVLNLTVEFINNLHDIVYNNLTKDDDNLDYDDDYDDDELDDDYDGYDYDEEYYYGNTANDSTKVVNIYGDVTIHSDGPNVISIHNDTTYNIATNGSCNTSKLSEENYDRYEKELESRMKFFKANSP